MSNQHDKQALSAKPYFIGFGASLAVTLVAYSAITHHWFNRHGLVILIIGLALLQFVVQLVYFLHLGKESKPRWKQLVFWMMIIVVLIIVFGSLWIMNNLNYHMNLHQMYQYLNNQGDGI